MTIVTLCILIVGTALAILGVLDLLKYALTRVRRADERRPELRPAVGGDQGLRKRHHARYVEVVTRLFWAGAGKVQQRFYRCTVWWLCLPCLQCRRTEVPPYTKKLPRAFRRRYSAVNEPYVSDDPKLQDILKRGDEAHANYLFSHYLALKHIASKDRADFDLALEGLRVHDRALTAVIAELERAELERTPAEPCLVTFEVKE